MVRLRGRQLGIRGWAALLGALSVVAAYGFAAVYTQPLASGESSLQWVPGQPPVSNYPLVTFNYVDGGLVTLVLGLDNHAVVGITVTGIETSSSDSHALVNVMEARPAVFADPGGCCTLNVDETWSARDFRPINLNPGQAGAVAVHLQMTNCEYNSGGQFVIIDSIKVHYSVLGFPHAQSAAVGPLWFKSPDSCPRSGPARPA
jgi:hypothetical protein